MIVFESVFVGEFVVITSVVGISNFVSRLLECGRWFGLDVGFQSFAIECVGFSEIADVEFDGLLMVCSLDAEVEPIGVSFGVDIESHI